MKPVELPDIEMRSVIIVGIEPPERYEGQPVLVLVPALPELRLQH